MDAWVVQAEREGRQGARRFARAIRARSLAPLPRARAHAAPGMQRGGVELGEGVRDAGEDVGAQGRIVWGA